MQIPSDLTSCEMIQHIWSKLKAMPTMIRRLSMGDPSSTGSPVFLREFGTIMSTFE
jgi:hypothetical protein